jgi:exopolysaccharide production protein ExoQ
MDDSVDIPRPGRVAPPISRIDGKRIEPLETILVFLGILIAFNTLRALPWLPSSRGEGNPIVQVAAFSIYLPAIYILVLMSFNAAKRLAIASWPLYALLLLTLISSLWSDEPDTTMRRSIALILSTLFCMYIVARFTMREFAAILLYVAFCFIIFSLGAALIPGFGIDPSGAWQGFTGYKNDFGRQIAIILAMAVFLRKASPDWVGSKGKIIAVCALPLLLLSNSSTSLITLVCSVLGGYFLRIVFAERHGRSTVGSDIRFSIAAVFLILVSAIVIVGLPAIVQLVGRDLTLTGRTDIWAFALEMGARRPVLGAGFRAFWIDVNTLYWNEYLWWSDDEQVRATYLGPDHGHSSYLDTWLELGWVGCLFLAGWIVSALLHVRACFMRGLEDVALPLGGMLSFALVYGITEKLFLQHTEAGWSLFCIFYLYSSRALIEFKAKRAARPANHARPIHSESVKAS